MPNSDPKVSDEKGFFTVTTAKFVENFNNIVFEETTLASR
jgi:hypothetical protein